MLTSPAVKLSCSEDTIEPYISPGDHQARMVAAYPTPSFWISNGHTDSIKHKHLQDSDPPVSLSCADQTHCLSHWLEVVSSHLHHSLSNCSLYRQSLCQHMWTYSGSTEAKAGAELLKCMCCANAPGTAGYPDRAPADG